VGYDSEWRPGPGKIPTALVQIASRSTVYLLDLITLDPEGATAFFNRLLTSHNIIKTGVGLRSDFNSLKMRYPDLEPRQNFRSVVDLQNYESKSLSKLCEESLGSSVCKVCQLSDWESRPLSPA
jgi:ribonuclease D